MVARPNGRATPFSHRIAAYPCPRDRCAGRGQYQDRAGHRSERRRDQRRAAPRRAATGAPSAWRHARCAARRGRRGARATSSTIVLASVVPAVTAALPSCAARARHPTASSRTTPPSRSRSASTTPRPWATIAWSTPSPPGSLYGAPAIVVDLGTATTLDVVAPDGAFLGGAIAPGLGLGLDALAEQRPSCPALPLEMPQQAIGT